MKLLNKCKETSTDRFKMQIIQQHIATLPHMICLFLENFVDTYNVTTQSLYSFVHNVFTLFVLKDETCSKNKNKTFFFISFIKVECPFYVNIIYLFICAPYTPVFGLESNLFCYRIRPIYKMYCNQYHTWILLCNRIHITYYVSHLKG